jgi:hypothetical protein
MFWMNPGALVLSSTLGYVFISLLQIMEASHLRAGLSGSNRPRACPLGQILWSSGVNSCRLLEATRLLFLAPRS